MSETLTPPAPATVATPWYEGKADPGLVGYWQNRGWADKDPATIAIEATKAAQEAQRFVGVPPDQLLRLPKDASDADGWKALWSRLGAPGDAAGYDFSGVKKADGSAADPAFTDFLRTSAARLNLPKDAATALAQDLLKHTETQAAAAAAERQAALATERTDLAKNWGKNYDANMFVARQAAAALGVTPDAIAALENQVGYAKVMDMFRTIGTKIGEDKFVTSPNPGSGVMTREAAIDQKRALMADKAWVDRYLKGGTAEMREMTALNTLIVGDGSDYPRAR